MSREEKKQLRTAILNKRDALSKDEIYKAGKLILENLNKLSEFLKSEHIFCYLSFRSEVPTQDIIEYCQLSNKKVYIPKCVDETKEMIISLYDENVSLQASKYGVMEPSNSSIKIANRNILDAVLIPGAVFDRRGYRIGYGAGYYDKFFAHADKKMHKIALAFSFQIIEEVPKDDFDVPVDYIVTEKEIILCKR